MNDAVNHPQHYQSETGIECIDVVRWMSFNLGNAVKYLWRAGQKGSAIEDLRKAIWYITDEQKRFAAHEEYWTLVTERPNVDPEAASFHMTPHIAQAFFCLFGVAFAEMQSSALYVAIGYIKQEIDRLELREDIGIGMEARLNPEQVP